MATAEALSLGAMDTRGDKVEASDALQRSRSGADMDLVASLQRRLEEESIFMTAGLRGEAVDGASPDVPGLRADMPARSASWNVHRPHEGSEPHRRHSDSSRLMPPQAVAPAPSLADLPAITVSPPTRLAPTESQTRKEPPHRSLSLAELLAFAGGAHLPSVPPAGGAGSRAPAPTLNELPQMPANGSGSQSEPTIAEEPLADDQGGRDVKLAVNLTNGILPPSGVCLRISEAPESAFASSAQEENSEAASLVGDDDNQAAEGNLEGSASAFGLSEASVFGQSEAALVSERADDEAANPASSATAGPLAASAAVGGDISQESWRAALETSLAAAAAQMAAEESAEASSASGAGGRDRHAPVATGSGVIAPRGTTKLEKEELDELNLEAEVESSDDAGSRASSGGCLRKKSDGGETEGDIDLMERMRTTKTDALISAATAGASDSGSGGAGSGGAGDETSAGTEGQAVSISGGSAEEGPGSAEEEEEEASPRSKEGPMAPRSTLKPGEPTLAGEGEVADSNCSGSRLAACGGGSVDMDFLCQVKQKLDQVSGAGSTEAGSSAPCPTMKLGVPQVMDQEEGSSGAGGAPCESTGAEVNFVAQLQSGLQKADGSGSKLVEPESMATQESATLNTSDAIDLDQAEEAAPGQGRMAPAPSYSDPTRFAVQLQRSLDAALVASSMSNARGGSPPTEGKSLEQAGLPKDPAEGASAADQPRRRSSLTEMLIEERQRRAAAEAGATSGGTSAWGSGDLSGAAAAPNGTGGTIFAFRPRPPSAPAPGSYSSPSKPSPKAAMARLWLLSDGQLSAENQALRTEITSLKTSLKRRRGELGAPSSPCVPEATKASSSRASTACGGGAAAAALLSRGN